MTGPGSEGEVDAVDLAWAEFLSSMLRDTPLDFEAFCSRHGSVSDELRRLYEQNAPLLRALSRLRAAAGAKEPSAANLEERLAALEDRSGDAPRFEDRGLLGRGGMGVVHSLFDRDLRRFVAKKVVRPLGSVTGRMDDRQRDLVARFLQEAQVMAQLDHPGVVPVHDLGIDEQGRLFYTMRQVDGGTLSALFEEARRQDDDRGKARAVRVLVQVCETVAYAHSKGVIHRDLKPANVMVGRFGEVYVLDWGLSKRIGSETDPPVRAPDAAGDPAPDHGTDVSPVETRPGVRVGTPAYMAPEQVLGDSAELDGRVDVYAVGAMLYELLTGRAPRQGRGRSPEPLGEVAAGEPAELRAICEKAMAWDREERYPGMGALTSDLQAYLEVRVVRAYQGGPLVALRKWVRRNRGLALGTAASAVLAVSLGWAVWAWAGRGRVLAWNSYVARIAEAEGFLDAGEAALAAVALQACEPTLRGWEWSHLMHRANGAVRRAATPRKPGHNVYVRSIACGPNGTIAWGGDRSVHLWRPDADPVELVSVPGGGEAASLAFDAPGSRLAAGWEDGHVRVYDLATGTEILDLARGEGSDPPGAVLLVDFGTEGDRLLSASASGDVETWSTETGERLAHWRISTEPLYAIDVDPSWSWVAYGTTTARIGAHELTSGDTVQLGAGLVLSLALSSDGRRAAFTDPAARCVRVRELEEGDEGELRLLHEAAPAAVAFSLDGSSVVTGARDGSVRTWDASTGEELARWTGHGDGCAVVVASPSGSAPIVSGGLDGSVLVWDPAQSTSRATLFDLREAVEVLRVDPDGRGAARSADGQVVLWSGTDEAIPPVPLDLERPALSLDVDGSGERLVVGLSGGGIQVWDRAGPRLSLEIEHEGRFALRLALSPDGRTMCVGVQEGSVEVFDLDEGRRMRLEESSRGVVRAARFTPDGSLLAVALDREEVKEVAVWRTGDWTECVRIRREEATSGGTFPAYSLSFDTEGERLATGWGDHVVLISDPRSGKLHRRLRGGGGTLEGAVTALRFLGRNRIALALSGGRIEVWAIDQGDLVLSLRGHRDAVRDLEWLAAEDSLLSASRDGSVRVWRSRDP